MVSTFTPRINLEKPGKPDQMNLGDNVLSSNYQKIDDAIGTHVNAAPPVVMFNGKLWTATNDTFLRDQFSWRFLGNPTYERGFKSYDADSVLSQCPAPDPTEVKLLQVNVETEMNRQYLVDYSSFFKFPNSSNPGERWICRFRVDGVLVHTRNFEWYVGDDVVGMDIMGWFTFNETVAPATRVLEFWMTYQSTFGPPAEANTGGVQTTLNVQDWQAP